MKVAVIGGSGRAGSQIVQELARRGHQVTAIARHPDKIPQAPGVTAKAGDIHDAGAMAEAIKGHEVVVSALRFLDATPAEVIAVLKASGVPRYLIVGGASSLLMGGQRLFDSPHFPGEYKAEAGAGIDFLDALKAEPELDWTYLSPSMIFDGDERTGKFRLGGLGEAGRDAVGPDGDDRGGAGRVLAADHLQDLAALGPIALVGGAGLGQHQVAVAQLGRGRFMDEQAVLGATVHRLDAHLSARLADHPQHLLSPQAHALDQPGLGLAVFSAFEPHQQPVAQARRGAGRGLVLAGA